MGSWLNGWPLGDRIVTSSDKLLWGRTHVRQLEALSQGTSVIQPELRSLSYNLADNAVTSILQSGRGLVLATLDLESNSPCNPTPSQDGTERLDVTLPFGLRSATKNFRALAYG